MIETIKVWIILFLPLWILVFYDIYRSDNGSTKKIMLALLNLVLLQIGSILYLLAVYIEGDKSFVIDEIKRTWKLFKKAFSKKLATITLIDVALVLVLVLVGFACVQWYVAASAKVEEQTQLGLIKEKLSQAELDGSLTAMMEHSVQLLRSFLITSAIVGILIFLVVLILFTYIKGLQWAMLRRCKLSKTYLWKGYLFTLFGGLLFFLWMAFIFVFVKFQYKSMLFLISTMIAIYFAYHFQYYLIKQPGWKSLWKGWRNASMKYFTIPYTFLVIFFIVVSSLYGLIQSLPLLGIPLGIVLLLFFLTLVKQIVVLNLDFRQHL